MEEDAKATDRLREAEAQKARLNADLEAILASLKSPVLPLKEPERLRQSIQVVESIEEKFFKAWMAHRHKWSNFLLVAMSFSLACQTALVALVGTGKFDFSKYQFFLDSVACELFAQIALMCGIVVKALFPVDPKLGRFSKPKKSDPGAT